MTGLKPGILFLVLSPLLGCADQMVGWGLNERPTVDTTLPAYGATDVGLGTLIIAEFSEEMNPLTINGDTFYVRHGATPVAGDIHYEGVTATFTPDQPLLASTVYSVVVDNDASDLSGLGMEADVGWSFTTGRVVDIIGPTVLFVTPDDLETGVELDTTLSATFSEVMHPLTINTDTFILTGPTGIRVDGVVTQYGTTAWFNPDVDLLLDTEYTATITEQAQDISGNALPGDYVWTFETGLTLPAGTPYVVVTDPDDGDIEVPLTTSVSATFSEAMNPLTISDTTFLLSDGLVDIEGIVTISGLTAWFDPLIDLEPETEYTATITDDAQDLTGNAIAADYLWTFTTGLEAIPPEVSSTNPEDMEQNVLLGADVIATFSELMDQATIDELSFYVTGVNPLVHLAGEVTYDPLTMTATFDPLLALEEGVVYTATVTTDATDLVGNPLAENYVWTFSSEVFAGQHPLDLRSLGTFVVVANTSLTNSNVSGPTTLGGDVAVFGDPPTCMGDGSPCSLTNPIVTGTLYLGGAEADQAATDLTAVFTEAMNRVPVFQTTAALAATTLTPGIYKSASGLSVTGTIILDGQGDQNAVFIFQSVAELVVNDNAQIVLTNGTQAKYVYWAVGSSSTIGTNVSFQGTVMASTSNTIGTDSTVIGRLLCSTGAITLESDTITLPLP